MNNNCNCNDCDPCKKCCEQPCGCPEQILSITPVHDDTPAWLRWNLGGKSIDYDFKPVVKSAETDTSVRIDNTNRTLVYNAEKHIDSFSAKELGNIFHIADIGDVDITGVTDNSLFVYKKNSDCGQGCEGINNSWIAWNSEEHLENGLQTVMGFDAQNRPQALKYPVSTNQYYQLGWNGANKVSYTQPVEVSTPPVDANGNSHLCFEDPTTKQQVFMKVKVTIASDGTMTIKRAQ